MPQPCREECLSASITTHHVCAAPLSRCSVQFNPRLLSLGTSSGSRLKLRWIVTRCGCSQVGNFRCPPSSIGTRTFLPAESCRPSEFCFFVLPALNRNFNPNPSLPFARLRRYAPPKRDAIHQIHPPDVRREALCYIFEGSAYFIFIPFISFYRACIISSRQYIRKHSNTPAPPP